MSENTNGNGKFAAFNKVIRNPTISPAAKGLYALLWSYADGDCICWPGIERLAQEMGCDERTIRRLAEKLVKAGAITKKRRGKTLTNLYFLSDRTEMSSHKEESDRTNLSGVTGQFCPSDRTNLSAENAPPAYGDKASGARKRPIKIPDENTSNIPCDKSQGAGKKKTSSKNSAKETDVRVSPVLTKFYEAFKENIGAEPTRTVLNFGRDGKRIKELPESYTAELLIECVDKFFAAPGYIRRNCSFSDFLSALPRLIKNDYQEGGKTNARTKWRPALEPSKSWDDWQS
ncbi:MAG: helix-turn-helix domain-containing protein [Armatimonadetes bacterium]|nr:helix-turn-helix domain-containing protein [Armatimonadota bacterium]